MLVPLGALVEFIALAIFEWLDHRMTKNPFAREAAQCLYPDRPCEKLSSLLPSIVREATFEPAFYDSKADYLQALRQCKSSRAKRFLTCCFSLRVALIVGQCLFGFLDRFCEAGG